MNLHCVTSGTGTPVTFIHGFTQTALSWKPVLTHIPHNIQATLIDAPGHGDSRDAQRTLSKAGADVAETMPAGVLVGYSMGARIALHAALTQSPKIHALCLISGTAGIDDDVERAQRKHNDDALADHIEDIGTEQFISEWLAQPMFAGLTSANAGIDDRLRNTAGGLANSLRFCGTGTQAPLWSQLPSVTIPVLIIVGEKDQKFLDIGKRMASLFPQCELNVMTGVGHSAHAEDPAQFGRIFATWLSQRQ